MLVPYNVHLCLRIEKLLGPKGTGFGKHFANSIVQLLYQAAVDCNLIRNDQTYVAKVRFLRQVAPRPGRKFYAPPGTKLKRELKVSYA